MKGWNCPNVWAILVSVSLDLLRRDDGPHGLVQQEEARAAVQEQRLQQDLPVEGHACDAVTGDLLEALDALPGGAGNRRFVLLSALRAHTKPPYRTD